jgi:hypothetical protein
MIFYRKKPYVPSLSLFIEMETADKEARVSEIRKHRAKTNRDPEFQKWLRIYKPNAIKTMDSTEQNYVRHLFQRYDNLSVDATRAKGCENPVTRDFRLSQITLARRIIRNELYEWSDIEISLGTLLKVLQEGIITRPGQPMVWGSTKDRKYNV